MMAVYASEVTAELSAVALRLAAKYRADALYMSHADIVAMVEDETDYGFNIFDTATIADLIDEDWMKDYPK